MTLRVIEGFDYYSQALSTAKGWNAPSPVWTITAGRLGGQAARLGSNMTVVLTRPLGGTPLSGTTQVFGVALRINTAAPLAARALFFNANGGIGVDAARKVNLFNAAQTSVAVGTTILNLAQWYYLEVKLFLNGASGTGAVHLNGLSEIGTTTANFGTVQTTTMSCQWNTGTSSSADFDDIYILDGAGATNNDYLGDCRVETLMPSGDGANQQWTPNSGTAHFSRVNEIPPDGDTSYVFDSNPGDRDTYTFPPLSILTGSVYGVCVNNYARKDDAATRQIAPVIRQGGVNFDGATSTPALSTTYAYYWQTYDQDPNGNNWTIATVNANEYGIKEVA
jgi:hypothetical protein